MRIFNGDNQQVFIVYVQHIYKYIYIYDIYQNLLSRIFSTHISFNFTNRICRSTKKKLICLKVYNLKLRLL